MALKTPPSVLFRTIASFVERELYFLIMDASDLITLFDRCFGSAFQTQLIGGATEPLYRPREGLLGYDQIWFREDYASSALHEIAHWCVAGPQRRRQEDYGYWYAPDGRSAQQQSAFERVEVKPQALEWIFSEAADMPFRVSADNLDSGLGPSPVFKQRIVHQVQHYLEVGLPLRANQFCLALAAWSQKPFPKPSSFYLEALM